MYRTDINHGEIKQALLRAGRRVHDVARHHGLGCDLIAEHVDGYPVFIEVKRPGPPSARRLKDSEVALQLKFVRFYAIVQSVNEAFTAVGLCPF